MFLAAKLNYVELIKNYLFIIYMPTAKYLSKYNCEGIT